MLTHHLYSALSLAERASYLSRVGNPATRSTAGADRAAAALAQWKSQAPFQDADAFEQRLRLDALTEHDLLAILQLPSEAYVDLIDPPLAWVDAIEQIYQSSQPEKADPAFLSYVEQEANGFLWMAYPLVAEGLRRFRAGVGSASSEGTPFDRRTLEHLFLPHLFKTLRAALDLVMVLELNVARLNGVLAGHTPEARFSSFCDRLRQRDVQVAIAREYPVLVRSMYTATMQWLDASLELVQRLSGDWTLIRDRLTLGADPGTLTLVRANAGDPHRRGRSVAILEFSSGFKLVYKPRSHAVDVHFAEFLAWINHAGFETPFRILDVIDRGAYGWSECVAHQPCATRSEVERFYHRLGGQLAVFYLMKASDMHFENLLAVGEFPVPVDLETLFHLPVVAEMDDPAIAAFQLSVMRVLLLPQRIFASQAHEGVDMSGIGAKDGQNFPAGRASSWEKAGTDEMRLVGGKMLPMDVMGNRPKLNGNDVAAGEYLDSFVNGFRWVYRLIETRRDELQAPGGMLDRFGEAEVRFIARSTALYGAMLRSGQHPDLSRNAIDRDQMFDRLWLSVAQQDYLARFIKAEQNDLLHGDIPVFTTRPHSRDLWTSTGERIPDVFARSAMEVVRDGLNRFGDEDLDRQVDFICSAITSAGEGAPVSGNAPAPRKVRVTERREAVDLARAVGDVLCRDAQQNEDYASWIGITFVGTREQSVSLQPVDLGLYNGLSGCSLFLAYLADVTGDASYARIAKKALTLIRRQLERARKGGLPVRSLGGYSGLGGMIYTMSHLAVLLDDVALLDEANILAADVPALIDEDHALDVIGGSAGMIAALEVLNSVSASDKLLNAATLCGERLLAQQQTQDNGAAWRTDINATRPLTGFSHGAAGIAWSLRKLAAWSGDVRFRAAADAAIAYERSTFVAHEQNWPDYRSRFADEQATQKFMVAWCHGAPGIALARIDSLQHLGDSETREEIEIGLAKMVASGTGMSHCLCHGDLGTLDILRHAGRRVEESWWSAVGEPMAARVMRSIVERGCLCGTQTSLAAPGLLIGLAGIGYGLLRVAHPDRVPSVLVLEPPRTCDPRR